MGNMSYCRFENTANDLQDCVDHWGDKLESDYEIHARKRIAKLAKEIYEMEGE